MLTLLLLAAAMSQTPAVPAACMRRPMYPSDLKDWPKAHPLAHGFAIGRAADLPAVPVANVRLAVQPSRPLSGTHLATAGFEVRQAGTYRVAAGGVAAPIRPLWLDVAGADYKPLASTAHGHGPTCTSITKVVEFQLKPGRYTLLATGLTSTAPVRVLIVRKR